MLAAEVIFHEASGAVLGSAASTWQRLKRGELPKAEYPAWHLKEATGCQSTSIAPLLELQFNKIHGIINQTSNNVKSITET